MVWIETMYESHVILLIIQVLFSADKAAIYLYNTFIHSWLRATPPHCSVYSTHSAVRNVISHIGTAQPVVMCHSNFLLIPYGRKANSNLRFVYQ